MKKSAGFVLLTLTLLFSCRDNQAVAQSPGRDDGINRSAMTIQTRFNPPTGYVRFAADDFGQYLRTLKLKPWGSPVKYFDGSLKSKPNVYLSVIDMEISPRDLQQCADAVMRLRGEFLFQAKAFPRIHFDFVSDGKPHGFIDYANGDYSHERFRKYMDWVFAYANTSSLQQELRAVSVAQMKIGDIFIQKRYPFGHAVIVVDMAKNPATGKYVFMLAQSYMPAQETQILVNPNDKALGPWYEITGDELTTPEWNFAAADLGRFRE